MKTLDILLLTIPFTAACVGNETNVTGTPFEVTSSASVVRTNRGLTNLLFTDFDDPCSIADESQHPGAAAFGFLLADLDAGVPPAGPGTYPIYTLEALPLTGLVGECGYGVLDGACHAVTSGTCTSGTVTLTRVDAAGYAGHFDVVIDEKHVTGTFDSPSCPVVSEAGFGTCQ
jgi:hypothetical protein